MPPAPRAERISYGPRRAPRVKVKRGACGLYFPQLRHPPDLDPFHDEDIAVVIEAGAVRADELAGDELVARLAAQRVVPFGRVRVSELRDERVVLSISVTRPCRSGTTTRPLCSSKWQGSRKPVMKSTCLPSIVNRCRRLLRRSATTRIGLAPRVSTQMPCGSASFPGSDPRPPNVRMYSALLVY